MAQRRGWRFSRPSPESESTRGQPFFCGTYPNNLGHDPFPGCFRCHDGMHTTADGERSIESDCTTCHALLAYEEAGPEILATLRGE